ncbi:MAG: coenzyme F420-0:L-glutamate ligase [Methanocellales archaeon]|nr:coenzyme F420-0:L-glutamate ligase [Methanocellales archaeon]
MRLEAFVVKGVPTIKKGDNLGKIISELAQLEEGDIIVVASTVISKSEGRVIHIERVVPGDDAKRIAGINGEDPRFIQAVLDETQDVLIESPFLLVKTPVGHICVNAGIDRSNVQDGFVLLLPEDPDRSAKNIRDATGKHVAVIVSDTCGRPFRTGQTGIAIGCAGIATTKDWRGEKDMFGRELKVTIEAIVDELAGLANILMGEGSERTPVVIIRGVRWQEGRNGIKSIYRPEEKDLIKKALNRHISLKSNKRIT